MRVAVFSTKRYDREYLEKAAEGRHQLRFFEPHLTLDTVALATGFEAVCIFVNDCGDQAVLEALAKIGVRLVALRCAGFNNVDVAAAKRLGIGVVRVPAYSPHATAEHAVAMMLTLNRKTHRAYNRVREGNFSLTGLLGFDMNGRVAGVVGTGKIGTLVARILLGFGCEVVAYDLYPNEACRQMGVRYVSLDELLSRSDIVTLHAPLTKENHHLIRAETIAQMKSGVMLINTSRGGLVDTSSVIEAMKSRKIGYLGLDVYEEEADLFYEDLSGTIIPDEAFSLLLTFPNVLITGHQGFFTESALENIAATTMESLSSWETTGSSPNAVRAD